MLDVRIYLLVVKYFTHTPENSVVCVFSLGWRGLPCDTPASCGSPKSCLLIG